MLISSVNEILKWDVPKDVEIKEELVDITPHVFEPLHEDITHGGSGNGLKFKLFFQSEMFFFYKTII